MTLFSKLFFELDNTTKTTEKIEALVSFFKTADEQDKIWAVALFTGRQPKRPVNSTLLKQWATELAELPAWLFEECYHSVGDLAETISLVLPNPSLEFSGSLSEWIVSIEQLATLTEKQKKAVVTTAWLNLDQQQRFLFTKLMTSGFRVGVSQQLMIRALSEVLEKDPNQIAHTLMGSWDPHTTSFAQLFGGSENVVSQPYPFFLAYPLEPEAAHELTHAEWQFEWKWDGIRAQIIRRHDQSFIWTRGEELVTNRYPELVQGAASLTNGTVLDGEILAYKDNQPLSFGQLQRRIGRLSLSGSLLAEVPVVFIAYDCLEKDGHDLRQLSLAERRQILEQVITTNTPPNFRISPTLEIDNSTQLETLKETARHQSAEGVMIKRLSSMYGVGRRRGDWWKWKVVPYTLDAVLLYAQKGHGRRADLFTDYTFGLWNEEGKIVPFAKAYSGLTDKEIAQVDAFIRSHTVEKFGPVRTVEPTMVFEIAFENIVPSQRHKAKFAVRFPRILRIRDDKKAAEADTLEMLKSLYQIAISLPKVHE